jgi:ATP adenylyltransferase
MPLDRLWAGWRNEYVTDTARVVAPDTDESLFETILGSGLPDSATHIVWRGRTCFAILNRYPYTSGHLLILPNRGVPDLDDLNADEFSELWETVRAAAQALRAAYTPDGLNIGVNIGRGAGAGVPDHLHVHVVPRWAGDTNFTTAVAETRVMPESLDVSFERISSAWPS